MGKLDDLIRKNYELSKKLTPENDEDVYKRQALASVVGGLTRRPVIAVPTSVGYGANFGGLSALLSICLLYTSRCV